MKLEGTVTRVENLGSPAVLLVTLTYAFEIIQQKRRFVMSVPMRDGELPDGMWPPKIGDRLDLTFDPATLTRPS